MGRLRLQAVPKQTDYAPRGTPADTEIGDDKNIHINCPNDVTFGLVSGLLQRLWIPGIGFGLYKRGEDGNLLRDDAGKLILERHVDRSAPERDVIAAIRDNLEATEQFELYLSDQTPCKPEKG